MKNWAQVLPLVSVLSSSEYIRDSLPGLAAVVANLIQDKLPGGMRKGRIASGTNGK